MHQIYRPFFARCSEILLHQHHTRFITQAPALIPTSNNHPPQYPQQYKIAWITQLLYYTFYQRTFWQQERMPNYKSKRSKAKGQTNTRAMKYVYNLKQPNLVSPRGNSKKHQKQVSNSTKSKSPSKHKKTNLVGGLKPSPQKNITWRHPETTPKKTTQTSNKYQKNSKQVKNMKGKHEKTSKQLPKTWKTNLKN